jgi:23S rRNA (cytosine1962-C5)-methyltransferase
VDFSASALARGRDNAALNGCSRQDYWQEEVLPVLWQLAGRKLPQRGPALAIQPEPFDLVVIDPPQRSRGRFGSTDLGSDYQSLFRPALKLLAPGGTIVAVNNLASLPLEEFQKQVERCARKAGCAIVMETLSPDEDFPSFDGRPPLKVILAVPDGAIGSVRRDLR